MKTYLPAALSVIVLISLGCTETAEELSVEEMERVEQNVRQLADSVAEDLASRGPMAWLDHFADVPDFFMASDGNLVFPDIAMAKTFVSDFAPSIADMELRWIDIRVDPIEEEMGVMAASYEESLTDTSGAVVSFGGYFTALAVETTDGWRFKNLHWSSPRQPE